MGSNFHLPTASSAAFSRRRLVLNSAEVAPTVPFGCTVKATVTLPVLTELRSSRGNSGGGVEMGLSSPSASSSGGAFAAAVGGAVGATLVAKAAAVTGGAVPAACSGGVPALPLPTIVVGAGSVAIDGRGSGFDASVFNGSLRVRALTGSSLTVSGLRLESPSILIQRYGFSACLRERFMASAASTASGLKAAGAVVGDAAVVWAETSNRLVAKKNATTRYSPAITLLCLARAATSINEVNNRNPVQKMMQW
mgnify:FL=1